MKKIKILIISIVILILLIIIILFSLNNRINNENNQNVSVNNVNVIEEKSEDERGELTTISYYKLQMCISQYYDFINKNNSAYYRVDENGKNVKSVDDEYINGRIYDILSEKYINKNKITKNNVYTYVDDIEENVIFNMLDVKVIKNEQSSQYIVHGYIQTLQNKFLEEKFLIVNLDENNNVFSVEPLLRKYNNFDEISVEDVAIEKNENNKITSVKINSETQAKNYLTLFKRIMLSKPEVAYNYLDTEYREKRFGNVDEFKKYVNNNEKELTGITVSEYLVNVYDDYSEFVCKDKYGRTYIFDVKTPLEYTVKLDTNTILTDKFKTAYDSGDTKEKVLLNINNWIQMLNNRDYSSAYKVLDETYRNNNFGNEDKFEEYMRENYPLHYSITYNEYNEENDVSIVSLTLKDITNKESTTKDLKIIMKLNDNYDFVMSFEK